MKNFTMNNKEFKKAILNTEEEFYADYCHDYDLEHYEEERNSIVAMEYYPNLMETEDFENEYEYLCKYVGLLVRNTAGDACACVTFDNYSLNENSESLSHKPIFAFHIYLSADHVAEMQVRLYWYILENMNCARRCIPNFEHDPQVREKLQDLVKHSIRHDFFDKTNGDYKENHYDSSQGMLKDFSHSFMFGENESENDTCKQENLFSDYEEAFREYYEWHDCLQDA